MARIPLLVLAPALIVVVATGCGDDTPSDDTPPSECFCSCGVFLASFLECSNVCAAMCGDEDAGPMDAGGDDADTRDATSGDAGDASAGDDGGVTIDMSACGAAPHCFVAEFDLSSYDTDGGAFTSMIGETYTLVATFDIDTDRREAGALRHAVFGATLSVSLEGGPDDPTRSTVEPALNNAFLFLDAAGAGPVLTAGGVETTGAPERFVIELGGACPIDVTTDADGYPNVEPFTARCPAAILRRFDTGAQTDTASGVGARVGFR